MPILFDPALKKEDFLYKEGREEGIEETEEKKNYAFVSKLLTNTDFSIEKIASLTETSVAYVKRVKSDLEQKA